MNKDCAPRKFMKKHIPSGEMVVCFWRRRTIPLREEQEEKMYFVGSSYNFRHSQAQLTVQEWWRSVKRSPIWKYHLYPARRHFWKCISSVWMSLCADYYCLPDCMLPSVTTVVEFHREMGGIQCIFAPKWTFWKDLIILWILRKIWNIFTKWSLVQMNEIKNEWY